MATYLQRFVSYCDSIVNGASTVAQQTAIGAAIYPNMPPEWTNAQKAEAIMKTRIGELRAKRQEQLQRPGIDSAIASAATTAAAEIPEA